MLKHKKNLAAFAMALVAATSTVSMVNINSYTVLAAEASNESASVSEMLKNQNSDGGWKKNYSTTSGDWSKSTIDNGATYTEIRALAAQYKKSGETKYKDAAEKGIEFLLKMQYSNGGWPQVYGGSGYHQAITFNDDAMINVMILLDECSKKKGDFSFIDSSLANKCEAAVNKGVDCLLKSQVTVNGKKTIWGQQHDKSSLKPTSARAYEVPSLCSKESANIVKFLATREQTSEIKAAIKGAVDWYKETKITGITVVKENGDVVVKSTPSSTKEYWGRFYEIGTNKPIFVGRDSVVKYNLKDIEKERRTGYSWYGSWGSSVIKMNVSSGGSVETTTKKATTETTTEATTETTTETTTKKVTTEATTETTTKASSSTSGVAKTGTYNLNSSVLKSKSCTYNNVAFNLRSVSSSDVKLRKDNTIIFKLSGATTLSLNPSGKGLIISTNDGKVTYNGKTSSSCTTGTGNVEVTLTAGTYTITGAESGSNTTLTIMKLTSSSSNNSSDSSNNSDNTNESTDSSESSKTTQSWSFNSSKFKNYSQLTSSVTVDDLKLIATSSKYMTIANGELGLCGSGSTSSRAVAVPVSKGSVISVNCKSSGSNARTLVVADKKGKALSTMNAGTSYSTSKYTYNGSDSVVYLYSSNSGINIKSIEVK